MRCKMEFFLDCRDNAFPCEVLIDEDNGRYLIKKSDSSGEYFNNPADLVAWIFKNWRSDQFTDKQQFFNMIAELEKYCKLNGLQV